MIGELDGPLSEAQREVLRLLVAGTCIKVCSDGPFFVHRWVHDERGRYPSIRRDTFSRLKRTGLIVRADHVLSYEERDRGIEAFIVTARGREAIA